MSLKQFFAWPADPQYRNRILHAVALCLVVFYGFRALEAEILRWGLLAALFLLGFGGAVLAGIVYWIVLLVHGIRAMLNPHPNGLLISILVFGALFAWYFPEPPLREEIKLFFNRNRYEEIIAQARPIYQAGERKCIELESKDSDLAFTCVLVEENYAEFHVNRDDFSLVYSYNGQKPTAVECEWNGYVWKQIDGNWFICKSDVN